MYLYIKILTQCLYVGQDEVKNGFLLDQQVMFDKDCSGGLFLSGSCKLSCWLFYDFSILYPLVLYFIKWIDCKLQCFTVVSRHIFRVAGYSRNKKMRGPAALLARSTLESLASFCYRTGITKPCVTTARLHFSRLQHQTPVHTLSVLAYDSTCYHRPGATPTFSSLFSCQSIEPFSKQFHRQFSEKPSDEKKLSVFQRFKTVYKEHGKTLLAVHFVTSIVWYGGFYLAARR